MEQFPELGDSSCWVRSLKRPPVEEGSHSTEREPRGKNPSFNLFLSFALLSYCLVAKSNQKLVGKGIC